MLWPGSIAFFVLGIVLVVLGVHQAEMARDLHLDLAAFGLLGALLALGFGVGMMAAGPFVDRFSRRWVFASASALAGLSLIGIDAGMGHARVAAHLVLLGLGAGCGVTLFNAAVLDRFRERAAPALALMHAATTAGAAFGPWLIAWGQAGTGGAWPRTFHALGVAYFALALHAALSRLPPVQSASQARQERGVPRLDERVLSAKLVGLSLVGFAYVGVENGLTLFAVPWAESQGLAAAVGRSAISAFWSGLMLGRLALVMRRPAPSVALLVACGACGALAVCAAVLGSWSPVVALAAAGLALGPVYPVMIALTGQNFPRAPGTALGLVAGAGACGGFVLPWLSGALGDALETKSAIALLGGCACFIALGALAFGRSARRSAQTPAA